MFYLSNRNWLSMAGLIGSVRAGIQYFCIAKNNRRTEIQNPGVIENSQAKLGTDSSWITHGDSNSRLGHSPFSER
jgi:hypothetical protein